MGILNLLLATNWPTGFWENLISATFDFVGDYGLTIIVFTVLLKIVLIPLDIYQKKITKDNTTKQAKLKPQLDKLNAKYKNNKEMLNQKTMELYKKENYNIVGSCGGMLLNLVLTLVIFITLFGAMNNIAQFKIADQYTQLATAYNEGIVINEETAEQNVVDTYEEIKEGFLWIENIWRPDRYNANIIPTYTEYLQLTRATEGDEGVPSQVDYELVMTPLTNTYQGPNGLFILIFGSAIISFFTQKVMQRFTKPKDQKPTDEPDPAQSSAKTMTLLLPILMIFFTWSYSSAFALYIITNSGMTMLTSIFSYKLLDKMEANKELKDKETNKADYSR